MTDFGRDISCTSSLRTGRFSTGVRLVAEAAYRRLTTPRGALRGGEEEANYGFDLLEKIGSVSTKTDAAALPGQIAAELKKDERIDDVSVTVVDTSTGPAKSFDITIVATTGLGPFSLVLAVSGVTIAMVGLEASS
jgi:hypothetical protein